MSLASVCRRVLQEKAVQRRKEAGNSRAAMALLREAAWRTKVGDSKAVDPGLLDGLVERYHRDQPAKGANGAMGDNGANGLAAASPQLEGDDFEADSDDEDLQADGLWVIDGETSGEAVIRGDRFFAYRQQRYLVVGTVQRTYDRVVCHIPRDDSRVEAIPGKLWEDTIFWELGETWTRTSEAGYESALAKQVTIQMWNGEKMQDEVLWPQTEFRPVLEALQEGSETLQEEEVKVAKRATWNGKEGCKGELQRSRCIDDALHKGRGFRRHLRGCPRKAPCRKAVSGLVSGEWPKAACEVDSSRTLRVRRGLLVGR
eukprot:TRINITY_DN15067_c0_g1_i2.p1 TRINITY_DN15067_c0_g1~~TRINITY_DN15067_c0_g1_i2.p1  ORF type:complete len:315 (-),score=73.10 TRINITY_DN15067_c0_g1_i2:26-970(-)